MTQNGEAVSVTGLLANFSIIPKVELFPPRCSWFAVRTRPRHEKKAVAELQEKGIETFLPLVSEHRQWSDRRRLIHLALFAGYVFVRIPQEPHARITVLQTNGVISFVGIRGIGVAIPDIQIEAIQSVLHQGIVAEAYPYIRLGQRVRIRGGSLDGLEGILVAKNDDLSLILSIEMIQRSLAVRVTGYRIEAI